jgi:hypothetical protein
MKLWTYDFRDNDLFLDLKIEFIDSIKNSEIVTK